jgi:hypothetical protein
MTPFKFFLNLRRALTAPALASDDPLLHPEIRQMDLRQLADLPFPDAFYRPAKTGVAPAPPIVFAKCA